MTDWQALAQEIWASVDRNTLDCWGACVQAAEKTLPSGSSYTHVAGVADELWKIALTQPKETTMPYAKYPEANQKIGTNLTPPVPGEVSVSVSLTALECAVQAHDSLIHALESRLASVRAPYPQAPANEKPPSDPNCPLVLQLDDVTAYVRRQSDRLECLLSELQL